MTSGRARGTCGEEAGKWSESASGVKHGIHDASLEINIMAVVAIQYRTLVFVLSAFALSLAGAPMPASAQPINKIVERKAQEKLEYRHPEKLPDKAAAEKRAQEKAELWLQRKRAAKKAADKLEDRHPEKLPDKKTLEKRAQEKAELYRLERKRLKKMEEDLKELERRKRAATKAEEKLAQ